MVISNGYSNVSILSPPPAFLNYQQLTGTEGFLQYSRKKIGKMIDIAAEGFSHGSHLSLS